MLATRDQENLAHGLQAAAATKPLNQGLRQHPPKTPANKPPKTPFKIPLNDENGTRGPQAGRTGLNGKENLIITGKKGGIASKNAFVTPTETRSRAPLGAKTTNAKAKPTQARGLESMQPALEKPGQKTTSARKLKPKVAHAELTKLEVHGDEDVLAEREIEYVPPKVQALPDIPDDDLEPNLSVLRNGRLGPNDIAHIRTVIDPADGLSAVQRDELAREKRWDVQCKRDEALMLYRIESANVPCTHMRDCSVGECTDSLEARKQAKQKLDTTLAALEPPPPTAKNSRPAAKASFSFQEPTESTSRRAAAALSQSKRPPMTTMTATATVAAVKAPPARSRASKPVFPASLISSRKKTPPPTDPSSLRHTNAVANSRTTLGYSRGRATSANIRRTVLPARQTSGGGSSGGVPAERRPTPVHLEHTNDLASVRGGGEEAGGGDGEKEKEGEEEEEEGFEGRVDRIFQDQAEEDFAFVW